MKFYPGPGICAGTVPSSMEDAYRGVSRIDSSRNSLPAARIRKLCQTVRKKQIKIFHRHAWI